jgi:(1->4)-alpha-D-glucan 1-alpha-D-glucosylmutase
VAAPGVPDIYAGTERWRLDLADPDNRRPVDFVDAAAMLSDLEMGRASPSSLLSTWKDGRVKLAVLSRALRLRRAHPGTFDEGDYVQLDVVGSAAEHVVAFARIGPSHMAVAAAVRKSLTLAGPGQFAVGRRLGDGVLVLPSIPGRRRHQFTDALSGRRLTPTTGVIALSELFSDLPVALLSTS